MKNYLMLNNKKIELTPEQVKEIENSFNLNKTQLSNIPVGETFKANDLEFIVLEHKEETTLVILKDFWETDVFDNSTNDYKNSSIRKSLNTEFYHLLSNAVGIENIVNHTVDLVADDGRTDYQNCNDNISLLTCDTYRKYVYILEKHNPKKWWWLATPYSVKSIGYESAVRCVDDDGTLHYDNCDDSNGVRPFCILKSSIFVSKQERKNIMNNATMKSGEKIEIGKTKTIAGEEFIILDVQGDGVLCLSKEFAYKKTQFDNNSNNYANSKIRETLNTEYLKKIAEAVGEENIIERTIDLTSDDGLDDYGKVTDKVGLLTVDMYRKYSRIIENYPVNDWWWLSTPYSTPHRGYKYAVRCVGGDGALGSLNCSISDGVRPFLIFNTSIF